MDKRFGGSGPNQPETLERSDSALQLWPWLIAPGTFMDARDDPPLLVRLVSDGRPPQVPASTQAGEPRFRPLRA
jgi:hypothetical protein